MYDYDYYDRSPSFTGCVLVLGAIIGIIALIINVVFYVSYGPILFITTVMDAVVFPEKYTGHTRFFLYITHYYLITIGFVYLIGFISNLSEDWDISIESSLGFFLIPAFIWLIIAYVQGIQSGYFDTHTKLDGLSEGFGIIKNIVSSLFTGGAMVTTDFITLFFIVYYIFYVLFFPIAYIPMAIVSGTSKYLHLEWDNLKRYLLWSGLAIGIAWGIVQVVYAISVLP